MINMTITLISIFHYDDTEECIETSKRQGVHFQTTKLLKQSYKVQVKFKQKSLIRFPQLPTTLLNIINEDEDGGYKNDGT